MSFAVDRNADGLPTRLQQKIGNAIRDALIGGVRAYRLLLSPWLGNACRFEPTCSRYAIDALDVHGAALGSYLALRRLGRCHPWCDGGFDPVPAQAPPLFSGLRWSSTLRDDAALRRGVLPPTSTDKHTP